MSISGIDRVTFGVEDLDLCRRFFTDFGLKLVRSDDAGADFETLNGCELHLRRIDDPSLPAAIEPGSTLREVIWSGGNLPDDQYDEFVLRGAMPASTGTLYIPAVQECEKAAERWIEIPAAGQSSGDLKMPAPRLQIVPKP